MLCMRGHQAVSLSEFGSWFLNGNSIDESDHSSNFGYQIRLDHRAIMQAGRCHPFVGHR
jgi:hypothetical protein